MTFLPLRLRPMRNGDVLAVNDAGGFVSAPSALACDLAVSDLGSEDMKALAARGHAIPDGDEFARMAHIHARARKLAVADTLDYLILVPTLRCNLACGYCQVSRAGLDQPGYDWTDDTLAAVFKLLDSLPGDRIKLEFQGGEATLRPDLILAVIERCERFASRQFVICTNLQRLDDGILAIFDRPDVFISTSLDGDEPTHRHNRTKATEATAAFAANLDLVLKRYLPGKVSALPTVNPLHPPAIDTLIEAYASRGFESIFLRPINYQGFARKRHAGAREQTDQWRDYYERFVRRIIERNWQERGQVLEETYLSICLRRILQPGSERHVDLRNPNPVGVDYIVIDHDGLVYPTDEARMLARSGVIDLSIGDVHRGWDSERRSSLNLASTNEFDPACQRCAYQPFCGRDLIDDIARYGRVDLPRHETEFCRRHLHIFDLAFDLIYSEEPAVQYSLARWLRLAGTPGCLGERLQ